MNLQEDIWKYTQAVSSLKDALKIINLLKTAYQKRNKDIIPPLWTAFFVTYARPFTNNKKIGKISDKVIPSDLKDTHRSAIKVRNSTYGHTDPDKTLDNDIPINRSYFSVREGYVIPESRGIIPHDEELINFERLVKEVHNLTFTKLCEYLSQSEEFRDLDDGDYVFEFVSEDGFHLKNIRK